MTPLDLARLSELAEKATPGPWAWDAIGPGEGDMALGRADDPVGEFHILTPSVCESCASRGARCLAPNPADAAFIAAFDPTTAKALLSEIVALRDTVLFGPEGVVFPNLSHHPTGPDVLEAVAFWMDGIDRRAGNTKPGHDDVQKHLRKWAGKMRTATEPAEREAAR